MSHFRSFVLHGLSGSDLLRQYGILKRQGLRPFTGDANLLIFGHQSVFERPFGFGFFGNLGQSQTGHAQNRST